MADVKADLSELFERFGARTPEAIAVGISRPVEEGLAADRVRLPGLDGLRALAVLGVLVQHYLSKDHIVNRLVPFGRLGVILFFVLSGFLITGILLRARVDTTPERWKALLHFYTRRALRIFPIYFLTIAVAGAVGYGPIRHHLLLHLTYLSSPVGVLAGVWFGNAAHLWSLCVEEQFYLIWPLLALWMPFPRLRGILLTMIVLSVAYKLVGPVAGLTDTMTQMTVFGCLDSLGMGGLLAWCARPADGDRTAERRLVTLGRRVGLPVTIVLLICRGLHVSALTWIWPFFDLAAASWFAVVISTVARGEQRWGLRLLSFGPVRYVGKISYGIYLYHLLIMPVVYGFMQRIGLSQRYSLVVGAYVATTLVIASLSWRLIETPLNGLKRYFPYPDSGTPAVAQPLPLRRQAVG